MRWLYIVSVCFTLIKSAALRSVFDHVDTGSCPGEIKYGNSPWLPHHYSIYLDLKPELRNFKGEVNVTGRLASPSSWMEFHSVNLNVSEVAVNLELLNVTDWFVNDTIGVLTIKLPNEVDQNEFFLISIKYEGIFHDSTGVVMQSYNNSDINRWIIFTHLEPASARTVFPCIDLPKYKATFDISIRSPGSDRIVLSNMPMKSNESGIIKFHRTPLMSTYLVAFVVCDYVPVRSNQIEYSEKKITTWVPREMESEFDIVRVAQVTPRLLEALETYFGNVYSLPKLDQFVIHGDTQIGGMENWGLIMYQASSLRTKPGQPFSLDLAAIIAHELSHHWFGNSVTVADWCYLWIQEALPTFLQGVISSQVNAAQTQAYAETDPVDVVKWTARDESSMDSECFFDEENRPLKVFYDARFERPDFLFTTSKYYKGASVFYMIESVVTPAVFKKSLQSFVANHNNSYATGNDLWSHLETQAHEASIQFPDNTSLKDIVSSWETNRGHPIVYLDRRKDGSLWAKQVVCSQSCDKGGDWWIPLTFTTNMSTPNFEDKSTKLWIAPNGLYQSLNRTLGCEEWIVLNILASGFYRVRYDQITWKLLIDQLKRNHEVIPPINRAMLVDDVFHIAHSDPEELVKAFEIMEYIKYESSPLVWDALRICVNNHFWAFPKREQALFKKYVHHLLDRDLFQNILDSSVWGNSTLETKDRRWLRKLVFDFAYYMKLPELFVFSSEIALRVVNGSMNDETIPDEIKYTLWCAAMEKGPDLIFTHLKELYEGEQDEGQKNEIFERLSCSKNHTKELLNLIVKDGDNGNKEALRHAVIKFLGEHWPEECEKILSFLEDHKDQLVDDDLQLAREFQDHVRSPSDNCKKKTEKMFRLNSTDSETDRKREYGTKPLEWLERYLDGRP